MSDKEAHATALLADLTSMNTFGQIPFKALIAAAPDLRGKARLINNMAQGRNKEINHMANSTEKLELVKTSDGTLALFKGDFEIAHSVSIVDDGANVSVMVRIPLDDVRLISWRRPDLGQEPEAA